MAQHRERKCVDVPVVPMCGQPPNEDWLAIHVVVSAAEACGIPTGEAFETAMFLKVCQVPVNYTVEVLGACRRWRQ
jgi:hypothetical protein